MTWVGYVDESMRQRRDGSGIYILAAAVLDRSKADHIREVTRSLAPRNQRFHWRDEKPPSRMKAIDTVARFDAMHIVVVGTALLSAKQERGRRKCLEHLLWHLQNADVPRVWLEARTASLNSHDVLAVEAMRSQKIIDPRLHVDFAYPSREPLIWLPDIVAGAVNAARDGDQRYVMPLRPHLKEHMIELD